jgi:hypothetical protein
VRALAGAAGGELLEHHRFPHGGQASAHGGRHLHLDQHGPGAPAAPLDQTVLGQMADLRGSSRESVGVLQGGRGWGLVGKSAGRSHLWPLWGAVRRAMHGQCGRGVRCWLLARRPPLACVLQASSYQQQLASYWQAPTSSSLG